jgi:hypothetical protein
MNRFFFLTLFVFCLTHLSIGQDGPCLHILQNGTEATLSANTCPLNGKHSDATSSQELVEFRHPDKTASVDDPAGWLKAFWIFGDGNFAAFTDSDKATEQLSLDIDYIYHLSGDYNVIPLMVEKKTNKIPPGSDYRKVKVIKSSTSNPTGVKNNTTAVGIQRAPTPFRKEIQTPDRAGILPSAKVRLGGYETALAVSANMPSSTTQGVALLYYNSVKTSDRTPFGPGEIFKTSAVKVSQAKYTPENSHLVITATALPDFLKPAETSRTYSNVLIQPMDVDRGILPPAFDEFRYFPILTTPAASGNSFNTGIAALDATGMGFTQFTVLILQNTIANIDGPEVGFSEGQGGADNITESERLRIISEINANLSWLNGTFDPVTLKMNGTEKYIRGVYHITSEIVAVIDPTELRVNKICPVDHVENQFLADLTMTVCNEGNMTERKVIVNIFKAPGIVISDLQFDSSQISSTLHLNQADTIWQFAYTKNGGLQGAYEDGSYKSSCFDVHFNVKTNWTGVESLQKGKGLTAKVHFTSAVVNAIQYFPNLEFRDAKINPKQGYNCLPPDESCLWLLVVLFALLLVVWWYWKNKQEEEGNA